MTHRIGLFKLIMTPLCRICVGKVSMQVLVSNTWLSLWSACASCLVYYLSHRCS